MDEQTTYIALLRGINVGGHRPLKMEELRQMFVMLGFENVSTYIQSGNVVFDAADQDESQLATKIKNQIADTFEYDVPMIICTVEQLQKTLAELPFQKRESWKRYISFLSEQPNEKKQQKLVSQSNEIECFKMGNLVVYAHIDKETDQKQQFSTSFIERTLKVSVTNRNLRTVRKILTLASSR